MNRELGKVEVTYQLTNREVWIVYNSYSNSVNVDLHYRGMFASMVFRMQNGQLTVPPKNCSPSEQSISVHAFQIFERSHSRQAVSNVSIAIKSHRTQYCTINRCSVFVAMVKHTVDTFGECFAHVSITRRLFHQLCCASALSMQKRASFSMMYYKCPTVGASTV